MDKLKFKHLDGMFWFFGILQIGVFVFVKINILYYRYNYDKTCQHISKNIFACLFSIRNTINLHVMNKYV